MDFRTSELTKVHQKRSCKSEAVLNHPLFFPISPKHPNWAIRIIASLAKPVRTKWLAAASEQSDMDASEVIAEGVELWARRKKLAPPPER
ncbi:hypothetical protein BH23PLA1_BH23PLA1_27130 [soil metagenome]